MYGEDHIYAYNISGTEESVDSIRIDDLTDFPDSICAYLSNPCHLCAIIIKIPEFCPFPFQNNRFRMLL